MAPWLSEGDRSPLQWKNGVNDSIHALYGDKAHHGTGSPSHLHEAALNYQCWMLPGWRRSPFVRSIMLALPGISFVIVHHWPVWYFRLPVRTLSPCNPPKSWLAVAISLRTLVR